MPGVSIALLIVIFAIGCAFCSSSSSRPKISKRHRRDHIPIAFAHPYSRNVSSRQCDRYSTCLNVGFSFPWFSGDDETDGSNSADITGVGGVNVGDDKVNASLKGVASIMDSMERFRNSQRVGEKTNGILQDLSNTYVDGVAADGKVKVTLNAQQRPVNVQIDDGYLQTLIDAKAAAESVSEGTKDEKKKLTGTTTVAQDLCDVLIQAMQDGHTKSVDKVEEKMKGFYSDLGLSE